MAALRIAQAQMPVCTDRKALSELLKTLAEQAVPGLRDSVEHLYTSTPLTYRDYTGTPQGSAYGVRKDCNNPLGTQLSVRTPIDNLLLTGQSLMLHGVHGVTMTALFTCAALLGRERIWKIITS